MRRLWPGEAQSSQANRGIPANDSTASAAAASASTSAPLQPAAAAAPSLRLVTSSHHYPVKLPDGEGGNYTAWVAC